MRITSAAAAAALVLVLGACSGEAEDAPDGTADTVNEQDTAGQDDSGQPPESSATDAADEVDDAGYRYFDLGESARIDSYDHPFEVTVHDVTFTETLPGEWADEPRNGDTFYIVDLTMRNVGQSTLPAERFRWDLVMRGDFESTGWGTTPLDEESDVTELAPGEEHTGRFWGDVPASDGYYFGFASMRGDGAQWVVPAEGGAGG